MSHTLWRHSFFLVVLAAAGCAGSDAQFNVEYAPGFSRGGSAVSIFGIFKDGRMSPDSWPEIGPKITASLGNAPCQIAYGDELIKMNPGLSSAVDDYVRDNGPTDDILGRFAPLARGDTIMTITVAGQTGQPTATGSETPNPSSSSPPPSPSPSRRGGGSRGRRRSQGPPSERPNAKERNVLEVSATLFSVALHRSVAVVHMTYSGVNADEGLRKFSEKLGASIPGSTCAGWNWTVHLDEDEIRKMEE